MFCQPSVKFPLWWLKPIYISYFGSGKAGVVCKVPWWIDQQYSSLPKISL